MLENFLINKIDDLNWNIELALAGYSKSDVSVDYADSVLSIKSLHKEESDKKGPEVLHKGIAKRHFSRSFTIADVDLILDTAPS